jgi:hypothetical protein
VFDSDSWGETVEEFLHSLGRQRTFILPIFQIIERPLWRKADIEPETPEIESEGVRFTPGSVH